MTAQGAYFGNNPSNLAAYESWLGHKVDNVLFYLNNDSWAAFDSSIGWAVNLWAPTSRPVIWSVPLVVNGTSLEQAATGAFDGHYLKAAQALAASRPDADPIYVRIGWEFNGSWMPWSAQGHEAAFIAAFQSAVGEFRAVSDRFKFVWDVNIGGAYDPTKAYPGDAYVDVVGMDFYYNTQWGSGDPKAAFQSKVDQPYGLKWQQDFAAAHGKATAISEWGVQTDNAGAYIKAASEWFQSHDMLFANYWESDYANYRGTLHDGSKPASAQAFRDVFAPAKEAMLVPKTGLTFDHDATLGTDIAVAGDRTISLGATHSAILSGHLTDAAGSTGPVQKTGDGLLVLAAANGYTGGTVLHDGTLQLGAAGAAGTGAIRFVSGESATLAFTQKALTAGALTNAIDGFGAGHGIDVLGVGKAAGLTYDAGRGLLTLQNSAGASLAALHLTGQYEADTLRFADDGHGGTQITLATGAETSGTVIVRVAEDAFRGDAQFVVQVDGHQVGGIQTARASYAAGQWEDVVLHGDFGANPNLVRVTFLNDLYWGGASQDRNLYVDQISVNGKVFAGNTAANDAGKAIGTDAVLLGNGSARFMVGAYEADTVTLRVSQDAFRGDAQFVVHVDGHQVGGVQTAHASHAAGQWETLALRGDFGPNPNSVQVTFLNDLYWGSPSQDRNLYIDEIEINGRIHAGNTATLESGRAMGSDAALLGNGAALFKVGGNETNALTLTVSGDSYKGDAQFAVFVDGRQVGGVHSVAASHAAGERQHVTVSGEIGLHPSEVRIAFLNDLYGGSAGQDRNLYVEAVSMNGHAIDGGAGTNLAGWNNGATAGIYSNGSLVFHADATGWIV